MTIVHDKSNWQRVSRAHPCPICDRDSWCVFVGQADDPDTVICMRQESGRPIEFRDGATGHLHVLRDRQEHRRPRRHSIRVKAAPLPSADLGALADRFRASIEDSGRQWLAKDLGVTWESLDRLRTGWSRQDGAFSFPMMNAAGDVMGIRLRRHDGRKFAVKGGHDGIFLPEGIEPGGRLLIAEGVSDCAALLDLGFNAIGRPSCRGAVRVTINLVRQLNPIDVVVAADPDQVGMDGAEHLVRQLICLAPVRIIVPPQGIKDARAWVQAGATPADINAAIDAAPIRQLSVKGNRDA